MTIIFYAEPMVKDASKKHILPLSLHGTPKELDDHFFEKLQQPLEKTSKWAMDIQAYEAGLEKADAESQRAQQEKKEQEKKELAMTKQLDKAKKLLAEQKPAMAIKVLKTLLSQHPENEAAQALLKEVQAKSAIGLGLFDGEVNESASGSYLEEEEELDMDEKDDD